MAVFGDGCWSKLVWSMASSPRAMARKGSWTCGLRSQIMALRGRGWPQIAS
jgi:hypothetical protein